MDVIVDIGLSHDIGFVDVGSGRTIAEYPDGSTEEVSYRECLHTSLNAQSELIWAYRWYHVIQKIGSLVSTHYKNSWKLGKQFDGIVLHLVRERLKKYQAGEKLDDFFQALMESKNGQPNYLPLGEIAAEISIMREFVCSSGLIPG